MSTPSPCARYLRGALVGTCSGLVAAAAHTSAVDVAPRGGPLVVLMVVCAAVGAVSSAAIVAHRYAKIAALTVALGAGQFLGHLTLAAAAGHHGGPSLTVPMLVSHAVAAVGLGLLIALAEYLFAVCVSVLSWLRLVTIHRGRPVGRLRRTPTTSIVVQAVLLRAGLGMRAPPQGSLLGG